MLKWALSLAQLSPSLYISISICIILAVPKKDNFVLLMFCSILHLSMHQFLLRLKHIWINKCPMWVCIFSLFLILGVPKIWLFCAFMIWRILLLSLFQSLPKFKYIRINKCLRWVYNFFLSFLILGVPKIGLFCDVNVLKDSAPFNATIFRKIQTYTCMNKKVS